MSAVTNHNERFPEEARDLLVAAGWHPGRRLPDAVIDNWSTQVARWCNHPMPLAAREALHEFGGLTVGDSGPGIARARCRLEFVPSKGDTMEVLEELIGTPLYPLGEVDDGHGVLGIASDGTAWLDGLHVRFFCGPSLDDIIGRFLLGLPDPPGTTLEAPLADWER